MNIRTILLAAAATATVAAPALAQVVRPKITLSQAVATAESEMGARAYDAEFDMDLGDMVYEVGLVKNGKPIEVRVDALTGRVVHQAKPLRARLPIVGEHLKAAQTAPRTLTQTIAIVEDATKGKVSEIGLERRGGRHYYEVELVGAQDREVLVDVRTGAITPLIGD
ncbi:MAG: PepSY domain-containing protein [Alphaproteobacteria bacterium]|nr:PepSY domain-containing protein [Alphaproteobacteria bacterium]MBU1513509.1 PepSY domain-containing protein [Alphaproteobacteria bacterium]MBU2096619.1 PepSY domain-containing protein [Alphaproteobacteria bacterium]MBU2150597.1 PepSY domain-containing protein [Alphaproteobacteria bacterium]MBU2306568.1 PepSY domain-containing protein [Alphaproteobacteria bacterium]